MGTGYTRTDTANNIANGKVADADDLDAEFNAIDSAFNEVSGHTHDGTADEGGPITVIGPAQEYLGNGTALYPKIDDTYDLGTPLLKWKDIYIDGTAYLDTINLNGTAITSTAAELNILDGVTATASELNVLDGITATTAELNILDGVTATATEINRVDGVTYTLANFNLLTSTIAQLNYLNTTTSNVQTQLNTLSSGKQPIDAALTSIAGIVWTADKIPRTTGVDTFSALNFRDEDNMASNDAVGLPSQQSVKAYADSFGWTLVETVTPTTGDTTISNTTDFATGYDYAIRFKALNWNNSDSTARSPLLELGISTGNGTYHPAGTQQISNNDAAAALYGWMYFSNPRNLDDLHEIESEASQRDAGVISGDNIYEASVSRKIYAYHSSSANQIYGFRLGRDGVAQFDYQNTGSIEIYRRRTSY